MAEIDYTLSFVVCGAIILFVTLVLARRQTRTDDSFINAAKNETTSLNQTSIASERNSKQKKLFQPVLLKLPSC